MDIETLVNRTEITDVLNRYALVCDTRDWSLFEQIFASEVKSDYGGEFVFDNRKDLVNMIRNMLEGCGPTQHLLGNYRFDISGDSADSMCSVRAFHVGIGPAEGLRFEMWGEYQDKLVLTHEGWRIASRRLNTIWAQGSFEVLRPAS